jgi:hypothetical protein
LNYLEIGFSFLMPIEQDLRDLHLTLGYFGKYKKQQHKSLYFILIHSHINYKIRQKPFSFKIMSILERLRK